MTKPLIRWEEGRYAESAYLGEWYLGAILHPALDLFVLQCVLPNIPSESMRSEHGTREGAKEFAEHRVREFLAWAGLPGRI